VTVALIAASAAAMGLRVNLTGSIPPGIYRTVASTITRGTIVLVCLPVDVARPARARGYIPVGSCADGSAPIGKPVAAVAGDTVTVGDVGVIVNGKLLTNSRPLRRDSRGAQLANLRIANHLVGIDELWLVSSRSARSFDSRYFGPITRSAVRSRLQPVLVDR
jgi:conjugative transfer signal peptidase TraF